MYIDERTLEVMVRLFDLRELIQLEIKFYVRRAWDHHWGYETTDEQLEIYATNMKRKCQSYALQANDFIEYLHQIDENLFDSDTIMNLKGFARGQIRRVIKKATKQAIAKYEREGFICGEFKQRILGELDDFFLSDISSIFSQFGIF